jgi:hypothetical protein
MRGEETEGVDPALSPWLLERIGLYNLSALQELNEDNE